MGMLKDKDSKTALEYLRGKLHKVITTQINDNPRKLTAEELKNIQTVVVSVGVVAVVELPEDELLDDEPLLPELPLELLPELLPELDDELLEEENEVVVVVGVTSLEIPTLNVSEFVLPLKSVNLNVYVPGTSVLYLQWLTYGASVGFRLKSLVASKPSLPAGCVSAIVLTAATPASLKSNASVTPPLTLPATETEELLRHFNCSSCAYFIGNVVKLWFNCIVIKWCYTHNTITAIT